MVGMFHSVKHCDPTIKKLIDWSKKYQGNLLHLNTDTTILLLDIISSTEVNGMHSALINVSICDFFVVLFYAKVISGIIDYVLDVHACSV